MSENRIDEISEGIYRISAFDSGPKLPFNEFLILGEEPLLFHAGHRSRFEDVRAAVARVLPPEELRFISFSHLEADEAGAMNAWLAVAPQATVVQGRIGAMVSLTDLADRAPRALDDGEVLELGGKRLRWIATPHVPHGWDAGLAYEETTGTLFCSDLFAATGDAPATVEDADIVTPALAVEDALHATALTPWTAPTIRRLAAIAPRSLALMHGPAFRGDCVRALEALAAGYAERL